MTTPLPVEMPWPVLSSSTFTSFSWAIALALMKSFCDARPRRAGAVTPCVAGCSSAPASGGPSCLRFGGSRSESALPTSTFSYSWSTVYVAIAACTFGSWTIWVVALFQAVLSSICRFTQVVRIETSARTDGEDDERPDDDPTLAAERCSGFRSRGCHGFTVPPGGVGSIVPSG